MDWMKKFSWPFTCNVLSQCTCVTTNCKGNTWEKEATQGQMRRKRYKGAIINSWGKQKTISCYFLSRKKSFSVKYFLWIMNQKSSVSDLCVFLYRLFNFQQKFFTVCSQGSWVSAVSLTKKVEKSLSWCLGALHRVQELLWYYKY